MESRGLGHLNCHRFPPVKAISLDDLLGRHLPMLGAAFTILDAFATDGMELPQGNIGRRGDGRVGFHWHAERAEFQLTAPTGAAGRHACGSQGLDASRRTLVAIQETSQRGVMESSVKKGRKMPGKAPCGRDPPRRKLGGTTKVYAMKEGCYFDLPLLLET